VKVRVEVKLKSGHFDPEGDITAKSLRDLGFRVNGVEVSKVYTVDLEAKDEEEGVRLAKDMCRKLLANPTKDNFTVEVLPGEERITKKGKR